MYELIVLGQLARSPKHGYMIAKIVGDIIGPCRRVQWGALYPLLSRLEQEGFIRPLTEAESVVEGAMPAGDGRARKVYAVTEAGRERLRELLLDTTHHLGEYDDVFAHKVGFFSQLDPAERRYLIRHYLVYTQQHIDHLERESRDLQRLAVRGEVCQIEDFLTVMAHRIEYWKAERAWAELLLAQQPVPHGPESAHLSEENV